MGQIIQSPLARRDLAEIWHYIALDKPSAADGMIERIMQSIDLLSDNPRIGPVRDDLNPGANWRSFPVKNYLIFYRVLADGIEVMRVIHGARDLRSLFEE